LVIGPRRLQPQYWVNLVTWPEDIGSNSSGAIVGRVIGYITVKVVKV